MHIIKPTIITDAMLISSNVPETDVPEWNLGTVYSIGQQRMVTTLDGANTIGSGYLNHHRGNNVPGSAFFWIVGLNVSVFVGDDDGNTPCAVEITDANGKKALGYIAGGGLGVKTSRLSLPRLQTLTPAWHTTGLVVFSGNSAIVNGTSADGMFYCDINLIDGQLYQSSLTISAYTSGTGALFYGSPASYGATRSSAADFSEYMTGNGGSGFGFDYLTSSVMTIRGPDALSLSKVTEPPAATSGGMHIVSAPNGKYRAWASVEAGFDWNKIATYHLYGDITPYHRIYESLISSNVGRFPPAYLTGGNPSWLDTGSTNRWKVFDGKIQNQTTNADSIQYVLEPGVLDSVAFFNVDADTVTILLVDDGVTLYNETVTVGTATVVCKTDIPSGYPDAQLTLTLTKTGDTAGCGEIVVGVKKYLGITLADPRPSIETVDYSYKEQDQFGYYSVVPGAYSIIGDFSLHALRHTVDDIFQTLAGYRATPIVYVGDENEGSTVLYGFWKDFSIKFNHLSVMEIPLQILGLT